MSTDTRKLALAAAAVLAAAAAAAAGTAAVTSAGGSHGPAGDGTVVAFPPEQPNKWTAPPPS
jgi:hypothetical protein